MPREVLKVPKDLADVASVWIQGGPFGSGRLIAPGIVLTARHTVDHPSADKPAVAGWRVRLLSQRAPNRKWIGDPLRATRVWRGNGVDLALLKIEDEMPTPAFKPIFTLLEDTQELDGLDATGYPQATWDKEQN